MVNNVFKVNVANKEELRDIRLIFVYLQGYPILNFFTDEINSSHDFKNFLDNQNTLLTSICKFMSHEFNEPLFKLEYCKSIFKQSHSAVEYSNNKIYPMKVFHYYLYPKFLKEYLNKEHYQLPQKYLDHLSGRLIELSINLDKIERV